MEFNKIIDNQNKEQLYPKNPNYSVFFYVIESGEYYLYALYTKDDYTEPNLIWLSEETAEYIYEKHREELNSEPTLIYINTKDNLTYLLTLIKYQALEDTIPLEHVLKSIR